MKIQKYRSYHLSITENNEIQFMNFEIILIEFLFSCYIKSICDRSVYDIKKNIYQLLLTEFFF